MGQGANVTGRQMMDSAAEIVTPIYERSVSGIQDLYARRSPKFVQQMLDQAGLVEHPEITATRRPVVLPEDPSWGKYFREATMSTIRHLGLSPLPR
jgi:hypothetical protein